MDSKTHHLITPSVVVLLVLGVGRASDADTSCAHCSDWSKANNNRMVFRLNHTQLVAQRPPLPSLLMDPPLTPSRRRSSSDDHVLDEEVGGGRVRGVAVVTNTNRYRDRRQRKRMRSTTTTTTSTTTTTTPAPQHDYYEYDDYYDYEEEEEVKDRQKTTTTTTTTTTTLAPKQRRRGRGRRRRPTTEEPTTTPIPTTTTTLSPNYKQRPDGRVIDFAADPNFPYELKGSDLTNYPFFVSVPENDFSCRGRHDGYYADISLGCQVYHHCASGHQRYDFLCPNYTLFDQTTFTCRFVNTVDCDDSESHYSRNDELYVESTTRAPPDSPPSTSKPSNATNT